MDAAAFRKEPTSVIPSSDQSSDDQSRSVADHDAICLTTATQIGVLVDTGLYSLESANLITIGIGAYESCVGRDYRNIIPDFSYIDPVECESITHQTRNVVETWFEKLLGVSLLCKDIDIQKFDYMNQYLLFVHLYYVWLAVDRILQRRPDLLKIWVVESDEPMPFEYYVPLDVSTAAIKFACQQRGVGWGVIRAPRHKLHPYDFDIWPLPFAPRVRHFFIQRDKAAAAGRERIGFTPAVVVFQDLYLTAIHQAGYDGLLFASVGQGDGTRGIHHAIANEEFIEQAARAQLELVWERFQNRKPDGSLPACLFENRFLDHQFEHLIKTRWLTYIRYIFNAEDFVARVPLKAYIHSEQFTPEGDILAEFYRRAGTVTVSAPTAHWTVPGWQRTRVAGTRLIYSRYVAELMRLYHGDADVRVVRSPWRLAAAPPPSRPDGKKLVLLFTSLEFDYMLQATDIAAHHALLRELQVVPDHLKGRVVTLLRPRASNRNFCQRTFNLSSDRVAMYWEKTMDQALEQADCVVSVNTTSSGYCHILEKGRPLVQVRNSMTVRSSLEATTDWPETILPKPTDAKDAWAMIEMILFDPVAGGRIRAIQERFFERDRSETAPELARVLCELAGGPAAPAATVA